MRLVPTREPNVWLTPSDAIIFPIGYYPHSVMYRIVDIVTQIANIRTIGQVRGLAWIIIRHTFTEIPNITGVCCNDLLQQIFVPSHERTDPLLKHIGMIGEE